MGFDKIEAVSLTDQFVHKVESMIISGELMPGDQLPPARELSARMGVSRPVISAGLIELEKMGFVEIVTRQGVYVSDYRKTGSLDTLTALLNYNGGVMRDDEVRSLIEVRSANECLCVKLVVERATQDELIQTAKLAVVGQTMTTLAHEINQPLNALSMYLFTAGRAIEQGQAEQARTTLSKAEGLINRIDAIIRSLRQFTRRAELETPLHPVDLRQTFTVAWELLAMRHKPQQGTLVIPDDTVWILGDEVRVHQVLVNVLSNALDACPHAAQITVSWQIQGGRLCVLIADNGPGWPAALLPSLLKPFTTSKTVGLGIGLSICVSLMTQMEGALRLASTFTRSACVVLEFNLTDVKDVE